jgi:hypothetical protein
MPEPAHVAAPEPQDNIVGQAHGNDLNTTATRRSTSNTTQQVGTMNSAFPFPQYRYLVPAWYPLRELYSHKLEIRRSLSMERAEAVGKSQTMQQPWQGNSSSSPNRTENGRSTCSRCRRRTVKKHIKSGGRGIVMRVAHLTPKPWKVRPIPNGYTVLTSPHIRHCERLRFVLVQ